MATVTLTWQIEGIHDGIAVFRSNQLNTGYEQIATLAPNTTTFADEFLLSQLTTKYGTEPTTLFYRLDAFRGLDVKQSDPVPVPLEDTMPEFLDGKAYLDPVPEVADDPAVTYYNIGTKTINGNSYHVLAGVRTTLKPFITDPQNGYAAFTAVNQFLRNLPFDAATLNEAIEITTIAKQQHVLGNAADIRVDALVPFVNRTAPILEVLPSKALMTQLASDITALANSLSITGFFWTSTLSSADTNEFGQVIDINVERQPVVGGNDAVSILGSTQAMTLTLMLIDDIS